MPVIIFSSGDLSGKSYQHQPGKNQEWKTKEQRDIGKAFNYISLKKGGQE